MKFFKKAKHIWKKTHIKPYVRETYKGSGNQHAFYGMGKGKAYFDFGVQIPKREAQEIGKHFRKYKLGYELAAGTSAAGVAGFAGARLAQNKRRRRNGNKKKKK